MDAALVASVVLVAVLLYVREGDKKAAEAYVPVQESQLAKQFTEYHGTPLHQKAATFKSDTLTGAMKLCIAQKHTGVVKQQPDIHKPPEYWTYAGSKQVAHDDFNLMWVYNVYSAT